MAAEFMTPAQVAERWRCDASHVRRLIRREQLPAWKLGTDYRIEVAAVEAYELAHRTAGEARSDATPKPEPPKEVSYSTTVDGFTLPADYEPVFKDLWPGHEATTKKAALSSH